MAYSQEATGSRNSLRLAKKRTRKNGSKQIRRRYLIASEGKKSEPNYFNEIKDKLPQDIVIIAKGDGRNTLSLIKWAEKEKENYEHNNNGVEIDEVWIVMDRDGFPSPNFNNAIKKAEAKGYKTAWSNECFELWILLYFKDINSNISREDIYKELSKIFGFNYKKEGKNKKLYSLIRKNGGCEADAISRASKLWKIKNSIPAKANPATGVFKLVETLNKYLN